MSVETLKLEEMLAQARATSYQRQVLLGKPQRALEALQVAHSRGARDPLMYAVKLFLDPEWRATVKAARVNVHSSRECARCGGDRMVLLREGYDEQVMYDEVYVRCPQCNAQ